MVPARRVDSGNPADIAKQTDPNGDHATTDRVNKFETEVEQKGNRIEDLAEELQEYKRFAGSKFADVRRRLDDIETQANATELTENESTATQPTETPLERICTLPEHVVDRSRNDDHEDGFPLINR
ncbi:hypothetical protein HAPAU_33030 [Halalkalicoccus paucihalophilus]|uniref:Chromosome partition protein Smc n=1 Tax=Halalkalicoccus paucihalophilus TaxID=1008153 RepID=A0A151A9U1_9EURY|nr:hypothetical protein [Halalkalicoccus paucihalophilus]KYH24320.1 hypothetical protein HAPAU_33030 [Halalkalicoccus paucihalophilus]